MGSDCIIWPGYTDRAGYGHDGEGKIVHRRLWIKERGPIPEGLVLDHTCFNRSCVNLDHLEPVTQTENIRRSTVAHRMAKKLTPDEVLEIRSSSEPQAVLAERFGTSQPTISEIRNRKTWKHI